MSDFVPLAQHFHDIVRANDPDALVVSPGPNDVTWLDQFWALALEAFKAEAERQGEEGE